LNKQVGQKYCGPYRCWGSS